MRVSADKPEIIMIQGNLRSGKTILMTKLLDDMVSDNDYVYANYEFNNPKKPLQHFEKVFINNAIQLLNFRLKSILAFSEIYHLFEKRFCMRKENIEATQAIQQIGKREYKMIVDCYRTHLLDFRFTEQITRCIHSHGTIEQILENEALNLLKPKGRNLILSETTEENYPYIFLYELGKIELNRDNQAAFISNGKFFVIDGRDYFDMFKTHEVLNVRKKLHDFSQ